jgi:putative SOS response-associated peptidase YedK
VAADRGDHHHRRHRPAGDDVHDRTPLILRRDRVNAWLDPSRTKAQQIYEVLDGIVLEPLAVRPVSSRVNRVGTDGPDLIELLSEHPDEPLQLTLTARAA